MKKIYITLILAIMLIFPQVVLAAGGVSISAPSSVESGNNVTIKVTISNVAAWNIKITASGATDGVTKSYADATEDALNTTKTFSITCNSKGTGSINIKVSGDVTTQDGKNTDISSSKTISVTAKTTPVPTPTPAPTPSNPSSKPNTENGGEILYKLTSDNLKEMGLKDVKLGSNEEYLVKYNIKDVTVEVYNTSGYENNGTTVYSLSELEKI